MGKTRETGWGVNGCEIGAARQPDMGLNKI